MAEASICAAANLDWHGKRCKGAVGVVYFALERADLVMRRLQAHRERMGLANLPIAVVSCTINLMNPKTVPIVVATIREAEICFGMPAGLIVLDTFAKLIAAGGGDEDRAKDQGAVFANVQRVKEQADVHVALIGHTGKDESRGARGSNAILGEADVMVKLSGEQIRTATILKANELPEGPLFSFKSELHEFGTDEDGDPISVNIVCPSDEPGASSEPRRSARLPKAAQTALRALRAAVDECGQVPSASNHVPPHVRTVTVDQWRTYAYRMGISATDTTPRAQQAAFKRAVEQLVGTGHVSCWDDLAWPV
jgi:hypothetical protein